MSNFLLENNQKKLIICIGNCLKEIKKIENISGDTKESFDILISSIRIFTRFFSFMTLNFKIKSIYNKGSTKEELQNIIKCSVFISQVLSSFATQNDDEYLFSGNRPKNYEFLDSISEVEKSKLFRHYLVILELLNINITNERLTFILREERLNFVKDFQSLFNFRKLIDIYYDPTHQDNIEISIFIKSYFQKLSTYADEASEAYELSSRSNIDYLRKGIYILNFLLRLNRVGEFKIINEKNVKKKIEIWNKKLE